MKNYLKYYSIFLLKLITTNVAKCVFIILAIISFQFAGTISDTKYEKEIVEQLEVNGDYLYISTDISDSKVNYEIHKRDEPVELEEGKLIWYEYSGGNIFLWVFFVVCCGVVIGTTFTNDNDTNWDIKRVRRKSLQYFTKTVEKDGMFYYVSFGRTLGKRDYQVSRYSLMSEFGIRNLQDVLFCAESNL